MCTQVRMQFSTRVEVQARNLMYRYDTDWDLRSIEQVDLVIRPIWVFRQEHKDQQSAGPKVNSQKWTRKSERHKHRVGCKFVSIIWCWLLSTIRLCSFITTQSCRSLVIFNCNMEKTKQFVCTFFTAREANNLHNDVNHLVSPVKWNDAIF